MCYWFVEDRARVDRMLLEGQLKLYSSSSHALTRGLAPRTRDVDAESETMRRQVLGNPQLMAQLRQVSFHHPSLYFTSHAHLPLLSQSQPELAAAAQNDPARFRELLKHLSDMQQSAKLQQQHEAELLNADPYNIEAQRKIEEAIRQEAVLENMESAMENMPEAFGSVNMLYVNTEVNGQKVKAFVDSGAQATISECFLSFFGSLDQH